MVDFNKQFLADCGNNLIDEGITDRYTIMHNRLEIQMNMYDKMSDVAFEIFINRREPGDKLVESDNFHYGIWIPNISDEKICEINDRYNLSGGRIERNGENSAWIQFDSDASSLQENVEKLATELRDKGCKFID